MRPRQMALALRDTGGPVPLLYPLSYGSFWCISAGQPKGKDGSSPESHFMPTACPLVSTGTPQATDSEIPGAV